MARIVDRLSVVAWGQHYFGSLSTGRTFPLREMRWLEKRGLVESAGPCVQCDGDGFIIVPESYREGWRLTPAGIQTLVDAGQSFYLYGDWFDRDYRPSTPSPEKGE